MSVCLAIRVQEADGVRDIIQNYPVFPHCLRAVSVRHLGGEGDNPHYHIVGEFKGKKIDSASAWVRRSLGVGKDPSRKGNGFCSCKLWDGSPKAIAYLFHEDPQAPLVVQYGFTDEYIQKCREMNVATKAEMKADRKKRATKHSELQEMAAMKLREYRKRENKLITMFDIYRTYMDLCYLEKVNYPGKFQMDGYIRNVQALLVGDDLQDRTKLYQHWFELCSFPTSRWGPHEDQPDSENISGVLSYI